MSEPVPPKVFISYSWTSETLKEWVLALATRLRSEGGANVILDRWHLKEGMDKYKFMEQMVTDAEIKKVLIVSDKAYMEKANSRKGGVGDESLIITPEIYGHAEQEKFIPLLRERDEDGKEYLPVFLKSRLYIDFCNEESFEESYDKLIRLIHGEPELKLPPIGNPPKHIFQNKVQLKTSGRFARLKDAAEKSKPHVLAFLQEYFDLFIECMEEFRIPHSAPRQDFDEAVVASVTSFLPYRDNLIDAFLLIANYIDSEDAYDHTFDFLERMLALQFRPDGMNSWHEDSFDNFRFINYEMALYFIAVMLKSKRFSVVRRFFESTYRVRDESHQMQNHPFSTFNYIISSLNEYRNKRLKLNKSSVVAEMISQRTYPKIKVAELAQADFLAFFQSGSISEHDNSRWWSQVIFYMPAGGTIEVFGKANTPPGLKVLKALYGVSKLDEF